MKKNLTVVGLSILQSILDLSIVWCLVEAVIALIKHHYLAGFVWVLIGFLQVEVSSKHFVALQWFKLSGGEDAEERE